MWVAQRLPVVLCADKSAGGVRRKRIAMQHQRPPLYVPDDATLRSDPTTLMSHLLDASKYARSSVDGGGIARLLEAAATSIQQLQAESNVQRGLAIASQTLATELALKIEQLQAGEASSSAPGPHLLAASSTPLRQQQQQQQQQCFSPLVSSGQPLMGGCSSASGAAGAMGASYGGIVGGCAGAPEDAAMGTPSYQPPQAAAPADASGGVNQLGESSGGTSGGRGGRGAGNYQTFGGYSAEQADYGGGRSGNTITGSGSGALGGGDGGAAGDAEAEQNVEAMVFNLKQRFKQSGVTLPLEKQSGGVYRLGSRKLQLSVRSNRLTVRVGSTYTDFLEFLSKAAF